MERPMRCLVVSLAVIALSACRHAPAASPARMARHADRSFELRTALIRGDLDRAHQAARQLAANLNSEGGSAPPRYVVEAQDEARRAAEAPNVPGAAAATARMGGACGACHLASREGPHYRVVTRPEARGAAVPERMMVHYWAADRMWEGLVGPSDSTWFAGALALADVPTYQREIAQRPGASAADIERIARALHELGLRAQTATDAAARVQVYGEFLAGCASCHTATGGGPRP
jgi:mono/diheme cytochrome c family protein